MSATRWHQHELFVPPKGLWIKQNLEAGMVDLFPLLGSSRFQQVPAGSNRFQQVPAGSSRRGPESPVKVRTSDLTRSRFFAHRAFKTAFDQLIKTKTCFQVDDGAVRTLGSIRHRACWSVIFCVSVPQDKVTEGETFISDKMTPIGPLHANELTRNSPKRCFLTCQKL